MMNFIFLLIVTCIVSIHGSCMRSRLTTQVTKYGTTNQYCDYNGIKISPGSNFKLSAPHCLECRCTIHGLRCCGFGFAAGVVEPPRGCKAHNDACNLVFVKENNASELCPPPNSTKPFFNRRS